MVLRGVTRPEYEVEWVNPADIIPHNPGVEIVNEESFRQLEAHFSPQRFDSPQVAWVEVFLAGHEGETRLFVIDGHTRTRFVYLHPEILRSDPLRFRDGLLPVRDVTSALLANPAIVEGDATAETRRPLQMVEYLRAVVPPTAVHVHIAPARIAAHLINAWDSMVGQSIARRFSALSALVLLNHTSVPVSSEPQLARFLDNQKEIMAGETASERARLRRALLEIAAIIRQARLLRNDVVRASLDLVARGSGMIGGQDESQRQVYGLLYAPEIERKLGQAYPNLAEREALRAHLGEVLLEALTQHVQDTRVASTLEEVLVEPRLPIEALLDVATASDPVARYDELRREANTLRLLRAFEASPISRDPTAVERAWMQRLGARTLLPDAEVATMVRTLTQAGTVVAQADALDKRLEREREALIERGVRLAVLETIQSTLAEARAKLAGADSVPVLVKRTHELRAIQSDAERRIVAQETQQRLGRIIDQVWGDDLTHDYGLQIRASIVRWVQTEADVRDDTVIERSLRRLHGVDRSLQARVIDGSMRLAYAERLSQEMRASPPPAVLLAPTPTGPSDVPGQARPPTPVSVSPASAANPSARLNASLPAREAVEESSNTPLPSDTDRVRVEHNNAQLVEAVNLCMETLRLIDLGPRDVRTRSREALDQLLRTLGRIRFDHPDIVRVIEEYFRELERRIVATERRIQEESSGG